MTASEIEALVRKAGGYIGREGVTFIDRSDPTTKDEAYFPGLMRFAELIERAAMERAAKIADNACAYMQRLLPDAEDHIDRSMTIARISELASIAADIRAAAPK